jgi:hypothetical protein
MGFALAANGNVSPWSKGLPITGIWQSGLTSIRLQPDALQQTFPASPYQ